MRLLRVVVVLALLAVAGLSAYAYFGDMAPDRREMRVPVSLTGQRLPAAEAPVADDVGANGPAGEAGDDPAAAPADDGAAGADDLD